MSHPFYNPPSRYPPVHGTWLLSGLSKILAALNENFSVEHSQHNLLALATCLAAGNSMSTTF